MSKNIKPKRNKKYVPKQIIMSNNISKKEFVYEKDGVSLKFTLRTDIKKELSIFKELMLKAIEDIDVDLDKIK